MGFQLTVDGFDGGEAVPVRHTCDGQDVSPPIRWSGVPKGTKSFALVLDDPDAPVGTFTHWLLWDIPAELHSLPGGYGATPEIKSGTNDFGTLGYRGPCPPKGHGLHRYYFSLYALDVKSLDLPEGAPRADVDPVLGRHAIATARCMGRYERK